MALCLSVAATGVNMLAGHGGFSFPESLWSLLLAYATGVLISLLIPAPLWGVQLAKRLGGKRFLLWLLPGLVPAVVYTICISVAVTLFNTVILAGTGFYPFLMGVLTTLAPLILIAFLVSMLFGRPVASLAHRLSGGGEQGEHGEHSEENKGEDTHEN